MNKHSFESVADVRSYLMVFGVGQFDPVLDGIRTWLEYVLDVQVERGTDEAFILRFFNQLVPELEGEFPQEER